MRDTNTISRTQVVEALRVLGIDAAHVKEVRLLPHGVSATYHGRQPDGLIALKWSGFDGDMETEVLWEIVEDDTP